MHEKPIAVCTNCGHFIYGQAPIGGPCGMYLADRTERVNEFETGGGII